MYVYLTRQAKEFKSEDKRFKLPFNANGNCPNCSALVEKDYSDSNYFSYPTLNQEIEDHWYCHECDHEWSIKIRIDLTLSILDK